MKEGAGDRRPPRDPVRVRETGFDARKLDVLRVSEAGATVAGHWPLAGFGRLLEGTLALDDGAPATDVTYSARGERRRPAAAEPEVWLHLVAATTVRLECQRCLQPMAWPLEVERSIRFVRDEAEAERLDEESEDDVLAIARWLDLHELLEDEFILALPIVPRHEACPEPLVEPSPSGAPADTEEAVAPHPFAALAALKRGPGQGGR